MTKRWAVAWVEAGDEVKVAEAMRHAGSDVYCPVLKWMSRPPRRRKPVERETAIMPTYIFVERSSISETEENIRRRRNAGFVYWLMFADELVILPDEALDGFREIVSMRAGAQARKSTAMPFDTGQWVRGVVDTLVSGMRGRIELALPGYATVVGGSFENPMTVPVELLELDE